MILSCEHAGNRVPDEWQHLFERDCSALKSHRGFDPGTLELGKYLAESLDVPLYSTDVTRLLVDCNRSLKHPRLFSEWSKSLSVQQKQQVLERYYAPHRQSIIDAIEQQLKSRESVLHIGVHSFTPVWEGVERKVDIGLLYDPSRSEERTFCQRWQKLLVEQDSCLRVRCNQPYLGRADGLTTFLRRKYSADRYLGIELEVNQGIVQKSGKRWRELKEIFESTLRSIRATSAG